MEETRAGRSGQADGLDHDGGSDQADVPRVAVIMGSDSDWPVMVDAVTILDEFGVASRVDVISAHRMPEEMVGFARGAAGAGIQVIIAGAGGAAHLPGMVAAMTVLPVIGVPVPLRHLDGMDSLLSIVQMPAGVPVATVSIGGARNAGLLAVRILSAGLDEESAVLRARMAQFQRDLKDVAQAKGASLKATRAGIQTGFQTKP